MSGAKILLTGVTGFVGKVVLEELFRRQEELHLERVYVLIRPGRDGEDPAKRFRQEVEASPCFNNLSESWSDRVTVIAGDLTQDQCGLKGEIRERIAGELTHIINCAASVEFDLPVLAAARFNIVSALNVLSFAKKCPQLQCMVSVSTAYVTPHRVSNGKNIGEYLVPLPRSAKEIYRDIMEGRRSTRRLLKETGHPNTYTLTKCLAEHLLEENKGSVPLKIVRPSIVSASWRYPRPGWIDSKAAFAGFVALIGAGYLRAVVVDNATLLDVVPVDEVAARIIDTTVTPSAKDPGKPDIRHAVAGVRNSCNIRGCISIIEDYFRRHPVAKYPDLNYAGPKNLMFRIKDAKYHNAPSAILKTWYGVRGQTKKRKQVSRLVGQLNYLNTGFPYFTHNTFDFRSSMPLEDPAFWKEKYIENVCSGVFHNIMKGNATEVSFAGAKHRSQKKDFKWVRTQPEGNWAIRSLAYGVRKGLKKCTENITFDRTAFEAARESIPSDSLTVIVPTHRSYMDFILCSYLFFDRPDLGIAIPHIAAAEEFSRIPILGWLFKQTQAFYIKRGLGRENPALTRQVRKLVKDRQTLEFFIEGTRSRSRQFLSPRRGILKCLQATGQPCTILPVSICYDRIPEEDAFLKELRGGGKPTMRLKPLLRWVGKLWKGKIQLGRVHLTCGKPLPLHPETDLYDLSREVMGQLQENMAVSTYHLEAFLKQNASLGLDLAWLRHALERRGAKVIESPLQKNPAVSPDMELTLRYQWMHWFYAEALAAFNGHPAIAHHIHHHGFYVPQGVPALQNLENRRLRRFLLNLFEPVRRDYELAASSLGSPDQVFRLQSPKELAQTVASSHLPFLEGAIADLVERRILNKDSQTGRLSWGPEANKIGEYQAACAKLEINLNPQAVPTPTGVNHEVEADADNRSDWLPWAPLASKPSR